METINYWTRLEKRVSRRRVLEGGVVAAAGAGMILVGCGDDDDDDGTPSAGTTPPTTAPGSTTVPAESPTAVTPEGKVTIAVSGLGNQNYDPGAASGLAEELVNAEVGEALVIMGPEKNAYIGGVASEWEVPSTDGLTWVFTLRDGVQYHDDTTATTEDIGYTIERFIDPENKSVSGANLTRVLDRFDITEKQVTLHLKEPASFIPMLAYMQITPKAAVEAAGGSFGDHPIGAGPFKFVSARVDDRVALEAFTNHYRKVPGFKELELRLIPEVTTRLASLQAGESDIMLKPSGPAIPAIEGDSNLKLNQIESTSLNGIIFLDLGTPETAAGSPWSDPRMREAVAHAIDIDTIIEKIYFEHAVPVAVPSAVAGLPGVPDLLPRVYDPAKAKALIDQAGHADLEFSIYSYTSGAQAGNTETADAVSTYLNAVGFKTQSRPVEYAAFFDSVRGNAWSGTGALSVQVLGGRAQESFLGVVDPGASQTYYYSEELAIEAKTLFTLAGEALEEAVGELSQKLYDQIAYVPLVSQNYVQGYGKRIRGWAPRMRAGYELGMEYIELEG
ncbi:MAG: ABC transporter substrate-binding protein [Dehalococcoidia bacterium]|nr:ABC transporter substrate-binding protein [Dehalococcoidia bacterium]